MKLVTNEVIVTHYSYSNVISYPTNIITKIHNSNNLLLHPIFIILLILYLISGILGFIKVMKISLIDKNRIMLEDIFIGLLIFFLGPIGLFIVYSDEIVIYRRKM